jgi:hypothetical protein
VIPPIHTYHKRKTLSFIGYKERVFLYQPKHSSFAGGSTFPFAGGCCEVAEPDLSFTLDNLFNSDWFSRF